MDPIRRKMLATGAAATAMAATSRVFAQQTGQGEAAARFYEKGSVRIRYDEAGSGFPLLLIGGGGLNSVMAGLKTSPFDPIEEFKGEYAPGRGKRRPARSFTALSPTAKDGTRSWQFRSPVSRITSATSSLSPPSACNALHCENLRPSSQRPS